MQMRKLNLKISNLLKVTWLHMAKKGLECETPKTYALLTAC